jgi:hypothetical protein
MLFGRKGLKEGSKRLDASPELFVRSLFIMGYKESYSGLQHGY